MSRFHETDSKEVVVFDVGAATDTVIATGPHILWGWHCNEDTSHLFELEDDTTRIILVEASVAKGDQEWYEGGVRFQTSINVDVSASSTTGIFAFIIEPI